MEDIDEAEELDTTTAEEVEESSEDFEEAEEFHDDSDIDDLDDPDIDESVRSFFEDLLQYGPVGLGAFSFISNLIPGFPAVYLSFLASYAIFSPTALSSLAAVLASGIGAGLGKVALFIISNLLGSRSAKVRERRKIFKKFFQRKSLPMAVYLFASLPLPDDLLYIPLGVAGFSLRRFVVPVVLGKITMTTAVYLLALLGKHLIEPFLGGLEQITIRSIIIVGIIVIASSALFSYITVSVNWLRVYEAFSSKGVRASLGTLWEEVRAVLSFKQ